MPLPSSGPSHPTVRPGNHSVGENHPTRVLNELRTTPQPQPRIPGYVLERELGRGGMGVVYLAWHLALGRSVAIKMMLAGAHTSMEALSRFHAEVQVVARLRHPHIVQIYDVGVHDGLPFCALEYLSGGSLADRHDGKPIAPRQAAELLLVLARAVQAAHEAGVVHRDLKPSNILFAEPSAAGTLDPSQIRITDFGVAKRLDGGDAMTATDSVIGTPAYMAPEQASGQSRDVGPSADLYSLGAILYELLTGRPPFTGLTALDILEQVKSSDPVAPARLAVGIPRDLETICLKCLSKQPSRRYTSAESLAADLERFLHNKPIAARPIGAGEKLWRWCRRNRGIAELIGVLIVVLVLAFVGITWQLHVAIVAQEAIREEADRANRERQAKELEAEQAEKARKQAENARQQADRERHNAETHLAYSRVAQARSRWERFDVAKAQQLLAACPVDRRGWEWHYLHGLCHSHLATAETPGWGWKVAVAPDAQFAVVACADPYRNAPHHPITLHQYRLPALARTPITVTGLVAPLHHFAFTPEGRLAIVDGQFNTCLLNPQTMAVEWQQIRPAHQYGGWLSSDGRWLLRADKDHTLHLWDVSTDRQVASLVGHAHRIQQGIVYSAGDLVVSADERDEIRLWELTTGRERCRLTNAGREVTLSADGRWLAANRGGHHLQMFDTRTGKAVWSNVLNHLHSDALGKPQFSPDGRWLVLHERARPPRVWETATGLGGHYLRGHEGFVPTATFSPDSRWVATCGEDRTVRLWDPASGEEVRVYRGHTGSIVDLYFSPDGRHLYSVGGGPNDGDDRVMCWDLTRDPQVTRLPEYTRYFPREIYQPLLAFDPKGNLLTGYAPEGVSRFDPAGVRRDEWRFNTDQDRWIEWHAMDASGDGRYVVGRTEVDQITRFNLATLERVVWNVGQLVRTVAVSPDGRFLAAGTRTGQLLVWDAKTDQVVLEREVGPIFRLRYDAEGNRLAIGGRGVAWLDVKTGAVQRIADDKFDGAIVGLSFQPNGSWLAATAELPGEVLLCDTATRTLVRRWSEPRILGDVAFHPDGNRLAVASREGFITLYDPNLGLEVLTLKGLTGRDRDLAFPPRVAFSPDGRRLVANDYRTSVWCWEVNTSTNAPLSPTDDSRAAVHHLTAAVSSQEMRRSGTFQFHLQRIRQLELPSSRLLRDRSELLAREEDWSGAIADLRRWLDARPRTTWLRDWPDQVEQLALLLLLNGDREGYRALCRQMLPTAGQNPTMNRSLVRLVLWDVNVVEPEAVLAMLRNGWTEQERTTIPPIYLTLALHRVGCFAEALSLLDEAMKVEGDDPWTKVCLRLGRTAVLQRLGKLDEAQQNYRAAREWFEIAEGFRSIDNPQFSTWLTYRVLKAEVESALSQAGK